jgi:ABC-type antimicrobial peptide transport system permease subunit
MRVSNLKKLVGQNLRRNRKNLAFSAVGIIVGISSFVFFIGLGAGISQVVSTEIFPVEQNRLKIVPRTAQLDSLTGGRILDEQARKELKEIPGVEAAYPRMKLQFLASATVDGRKLPAGAVAALSNIPGISKRMIASISDVRMWLEIMGNGIDPRLVANDVITGEFKDPQEGEPIPVLLSKRMVEIFNTSFAKLRSLPPIDKSMLPYLWPLPLTLNHSFISRERRGQSLPTHMKIVGLSRYALMGGITMPLETARKYNLRFAGQLAAQEYDAIVLQLAATDDLAPVQAVVEKLGYDVDLSERRMAEGVGLAIMLITLGFTLISLIIVGIAAVNISHTFFMIIFERKRELGLLRAVGATRRDVGLIILTEATILGVLGGLLGSLLGWLFCLMVDLMIVDLLPDFPFKPESFFSFPWWLFLGSVGFSVLFCWLGAFFPARRAARLDPVVALSGR